jgi:hypothetical protein
MSRPAVVVLAAVQMGALAFSGRAHACSPLGHTAHTVVPSMQATDHVPPTLPAIPDAGVHRSDGPSRDGCGADDCPDVGRISIAAVATDDMTAPDRIGYRFALEAGTLPAGFSLPTSAIEPSLSLYLIADDGDEPIDFTLRVVAIDLAGNQSAPQTVRVYDDPGGGCGIGRGRASGMGRAGPVVAALLLAARLRRRGSRPPGQDVLQSPVHEAPVVPGGRGNRRGRGGRSG